MELKNIYKSDNEMYEFLKRNLPKSGFKTFNRHKNELPHTNKPISSPVSILKVSQKCRICLQHGNIPIFNKNTILDFPLSHYLKLICNIDITANDSHPQHLCKTCNDALDSAIKLRKMAIKNQFKLKLTSLKHLDINNSVKNAEKSKYDNIKLMHLPKSETQKEVKEKNQIEYNYVTPICSLSQKIGIGFEKTSEMKNYPGSAPSTLSPLQIENHNNKEINQMKDYDVPTLTLEQVQKLRKKDIPYENYYKKVITTPTKQVYQCQICKKHYKKGSIADHILLHLPDSVSLYVCEVCGKTFKKFCTFYKHSFVHQSTLPFECKICPYKGRSKSLLQVHTKRVHKKEYKYQCTKCPKKFLDTNNLRYHLRRHEEPKFSCDICQKLFYENSLLKKHIESQHMDTAPHKCDLCGNFYKNRKNLLSHQIKIHKRKQVYNNRAAYLKLNQYNSDRFT